VLTISSKYLSSNLSSFCSTASREIVNRASLSLTCMFVHQIPQNGV